MVDKYLKLVVSINSKSQEEIDLAPVLMKFESFQQQQLDYASTNYQNPLVNPMCGTSQGGKFFASQLSHVVANSQPSAHSIGLKGYINFIKLLRIKQWL